MARALKNFLFANLVTSLAEERGKGEFGWCSKASSGAVAYRLTEGGKIEEVNARKLVPGDRVVVKTWQIIPGDGEVVQRIASIDESAITGESAPVICEAHGARAASPPARVWYQASSWHRLRLVPEQVSLIA